MSSLSAPTRVSMVAQTAYQDLLTALLDDAASDLSGAPVLRRRGARSYWYDRVRIGAQHKERYLGEATPELTARLEDAVRLKTEAAARAEGRARLVRLLRAERLTPVDRSTGALLSAFAKAGVFRLGGTIVGTHAFRLYEAELGVKWGVDAGAATDDLDIAAFERLSIALEDAAAPPLVEVLADFAFAPLPSLEAGQTWRWRQIEGDARVEFLTASFAEDEGVRPLPSLGVHARALHHLNYLIADPIPAAVLYRQGVLAQIPRPERYAVHKLIVADRRGDGPDRSKALKDIAQAAHLVAVLADDRPDDLAEAYRDARGRGERWTFRIDRTLARAPQIADVLSRL